MLVVFYRRLNWKCIIYIAMLPEEDRATAIGNKHTNLVKFGRAVFELCERTFRQTGILITILRTPPGGELLLVSKGTVKKETLYRRMAAEAGRSK